MKPNILPYWVLTGSFSCAKRWRMGAADAAAPIAEVDHVFQGNARKKGEIWIVRRTVTRVITRSAHDRYHYVDTVWAGPPRLLSSSTSI